jgi:hypothetical protein
MPPIIRVRFRRDGHTDDGRTIRAFAEDLDLGQLTPRARAFAEALHDAMTHPAPGGTVLDIRFESELTNAEQAERPPRVPDAYRPIKDPDQRAQRTVRWARLLDAGYSTPVAQWVEEQARDIAPGWYPIGAPHRPRVPSWEAGAADRHVTRDRAAEILREHGAALSPAGWQTLLRTGLMPPDRYVFKRPQWRPETVEAFARRPRELWPVRRITELLGLAGDNATGAQLRRWGIPAEGREPGRGGQNLYPADLVQAAHTHRPGRGARTDLRNDDA